MGICPTVVGNSVPGRIICPSDSKPVVFIIFFLLLKESFCLLESIMDERELHIKRADQTEITAVPVGLYQY